MIYEQIPVSGNRELFRHNRELFFPNREFTGIAARVESAAAGLPMNLVPRSIINLLVGPPAKS
jgi:hypothetical protein